MQGQVRGLENAEFIRNTAPCSPTEGEEYPGPPGPRAPGPRPPAPGKPKPHGIPGSANHNRE